MQQQVFEGTWEELSKHAAEFSGRLLRLILVEEDDPHTVATLEQPAVEGTFCYGALQGMSEITEEDFKAAEWRGEDVDV